MATATTPARLEHLSPILFNDTPVITTRLLAHAYGCDEENIRQNFKRNSSRFVEGKHFYKLQGDALKDFRVCVTNSHAQATHCVDNIDAQNECAMCVDDIYTQTIHSKARVVILWTERGAARHAKVLDTDKAWDVFELLEENYFKTASRSPLEGTHGEPAHLPLASKEQRKPLIDLVRLWVSMAPIGYGDGFRQVNAAMGVSSVEQMTLEMVDRAVAWVQGKIDAIQLGQAALPPAIPVESEDFQKLDALYAEFLRLEESMNREVHAFTDRLRDVTGPLYQEAVRRMTTPGLVALPDGMISGLHSQMRTGATLLKEGMESIGTSLYQARNCARLMMRK